LWTAFAAWYSSAGTNPGAGPQRDDDRLLITTNGTFNFADESAQCRLHLQDRVEIFPTAHLRQHKPGGAQGQRQRIQLVFSLDDVPGRIQARRFQITWGGTIFLPAFKRSFTNDAALVDFHSLGISPPPRSDLKTIIPEPSKPRMLLLHR